MTCDRHSQFNSASCATGWGDGRTSPGRTRSAEFSFSEPFSPPRFREGVCRCCGERKIIRDDLNICEQCFFEIEDDKNMIDDNHNNPPLSYYKSDFEKLAESRAKWKLSALIGWLTVGIIMALETLR
jgi:hypothetical protein